MPHSPRAGAAFEAQTPSTWPGCTLSQHPQLLLRLGWRNHQSPGHTVPNPPAPQVFFRDHQIPGAALPVQVTVTLWAPRRTQQLKGRARNPSPPSQLPHNPMHGKETKDIFFFYKKINEKFIYKFRTLGLHVYIIHSGICCTVQTLSS